MNINPQHVSFTGQRSAPGQDCRVEIVVNGQARELPRHEEVHNHSPSGFSWGFSGSGPAQLALAMCCELVGAERAESVYQTVKERLIAPIKLDTWIITGVQLARAIEAVEASTGLGQMATPSRRPGCRSAY